MKPQPTVKPTGDEGAHGVEKAKRLTSALVAVIDKNTKAEFDRIAAILERHAKSEQRRIVRAERRAARSA